MKTSSQQSGNADAASNAAEQGSAYSGNPRVRNTAEENSAETRARLGLFLADIDLQGRSSDHIGTAEHHAARARRVLSAVTAVDQLLPNGGGNKPADSQADDKPPMDLQGVGAQFDK
ncbi:hypothetical protein LX32DRAFT_689378 [Colletotrichum zoysiae]|uniref:Uncharacterized protein n=1 Tax=Colletotrichum zoysiae TaxID=1216348 RepID=A0AAD9M9R5_9PEZI|nr:hypothetical protein LX32DRAFT_689378 [Colletotrichum zoysiae]